MQEQLLSPNTQKVSSCELLNSPDYFFVSCLIARDNPRLAESYIVRHYRSYLPGMMGSAWQKHVANKLNHARVQESSSSRPHDVESNCHNESEKAAIVQGQSFYGVEEKSQTLSKVGAGEQADTHHDIFDDSEVSISSSSSACSRGSLSSFYSDIMLDEMYSMSSYSTSEESASINTSLSLSPVTFSSLASSSSGRDGQWD
eukprot:gene31769-38400_t